MDIPATAFVALGAVLAALVAGLFSVLGLVASKENKVSEFRLAWIDGLRNEVSRYTSGVQELARIERARKRMGKEDIANDEGRNREIEWFNASRVAYEKTIESLTCIHLRLNPKHASDPKRPEHNLLNRLVEARDLFNVEKYEEAAMCCREIRDAATPLLKSTWGLVKRGERSYRAIKWSSILAVLSGIIGFVYLIYSLWSMYISVGDS